jgi:hypothetical protein
MPMTSRSRRRWNPAAAHVARARSPEGERQPPSTDRGLKPRCGMQQVSPCRPGAFCAEWPGSAKGCVCTVQSCWIPAGEGVALSGTDGGALGRLSRKSSQR